MGKGPTGSPWSRANRALVTARQVALSATAPRLVPDWAVHDRPPSAFFERLSGLNGTAFAVLLAANAAGQMAGLPWFSTERRAESESVYEPGQSGLGVAARSFANSDVRESMECDLAPLGGKGRKRVKN
jgi:hypothetical protein